MEDILSSIRRVIAREDSRESPPAAQIHGDTRRGEPRAPIWNDDVPPEHDAPGTAPSLRSAPPASTDTASVSDDVLELHAADAAHDSAELVSPASADAARHALSALSEAVAPPAAPANTAETGKTSVDDLVLAALRPMLREWLDSNLPPMVERMVAQEIARISGRRL